MFLKGSSRDYRAYRIGLISRDGRTVGRAGEGGAGNGRRPARVAFADAGPSRNVWEECPLWSLMSRGAECRAVTGPVTSVVDHAQGGFVDYRHRQRTLRDMGASGGDRGATPVTGETWRDRPLVRLLWMVLSATE